MLVNQRGNEPVRFVRVFGVFLGKLWPFCIKPTMRISFYLLQPAEEQSPTYPLLSIPSPYIIIFELCPNFPRIVCHDDTLSFRRGRRGNRSVWVSWPVRCRCGYFSSHDSLLMLCGLLPLPSLRHHSPPGMVLNNRTRIVVLTFPSCFHWHRIVVP